MAALRDALKSSSVHYLSHVHGVTLDHVIRFERAGDVFIDFNLNG
jgi:hypothetical protein